MTSFRGLTDEQRWALAFYVANLGQVARDTRRGAELWQAARGKQAFPDLASVVTRSAREVHAQHGADAATVLGYLRQHPDVLVPQGSSAIAALRMRPAIAVPIPTRSGRPFVLLDSGANADGRPEHLLQFAHMGVIFAEDILDISRP